jgi:exo beta-1,2-glucooligosaccharide sophorohydrolase (non-reducing end)
MVPVFRCLVTGILAGAASLAVAQDDYVNHAVFSNSQTPGAHFDSEASAVAPSTIAAVDSHIPVETRTFLTPPNALRLAWTSAAGGSWDAEVRTPAVDNRPSHFLGTTLSFWVYAPTAIRAADLPHIRISDNNQGFSAPLALGDFAGPLAAARWTQIRIPLARFASASIRPVDPARLHVIVFEQGTADNHPHTLLVDEIRIGPDVAAQSGKPSPLAAPAAVTATGYERHVDLSWKPFADAHLAYAIVYRSLDGGAFEPVAVQQPGLDRAIDWVGSAGHSLSYKVAFVDDAFRQSAFSAPVSAKTHAMTDDELMTMVQLETFRYYWEQGSHPHAGMALESVPGDPRVVATGASGFGIMAIVAGIDRGFITREQGFDRFTRIVNFLEHAERFHGAWAHFMNGDTGKAMPLFGMYDDGADLVETSFLMQGLLAVRQYADPKNPAERAVAERITKLWDGVEWDWYAKEFDGQALLWHWSPDFSWKQHHKLTGFNETMIAYLLGIASPTHPIPVSAYYNGWASQSDFAAKYREGWGNTTDGNHYWNGHTYEGIKLDVGVGTGGPLFFTQYSFMGPDPHRLRDRYTSSYFDNNRNLALIDYRYCVRNPGKFTGYGPGAWGLTASLNPWGYGAHAPNAQADNGTISPTAALGAFPYTPDESMTALRSFYRDYGDRLWGIYGPTDGFNPGAHWFASSYLGLDQAPIAVMIENHRTGLLWKLFMANPEMQPAFDKIAAQPAEGK